MRIIVSFNGGGLTINFENVEKISDHGCYIIMAGTDINIVVNALDICCAGAVSIQKSWLLTADEVYLDTRIEEDN